ncbi:proteasome accessory factor PafA2 [Corynebacterium hylobatis]|uniref:Proteasome accessory factor PafA2 n=1 Tax=Corynebacterium hylobatis TaxID=1859290 RepID=A0A3S0HH69_9CORY|nr:depupylase/deamidase Dop [Corynebacterium hylobatis]RSZ63473.1 proteasome accessory factor PafA2 [Corynebacterium hylobatis]
MSRFMGTETEYGISTPGNPELSPIVTSTHAVVAYAAMNTGARSRWDYEEESPLKDTRGFDLRRYHTVPVVEPDAVGIANVVTANGARFYVDHAHPEYSSPEVSNAYDAMVYDAAGDLILLKAAADVAALYEEGVSILKHHEPCPPLKFYKNNVDGKGASYGAHENYQYSRQTDFEVLTQAIIPFFVTRNIIIGAGRIGIGEAGERDGFQISQRADYFHQEISLETTLNRGIVNTRDEPHANAVHFRRLHTIVGDANMSQTATFLKLGMTKLVIDAIEDGVDFTDLRLDDPVAEIKNVSHDLSLRHRLKLVDGRELTALEILRLYHSRVRPVDEVDERVIALWAEVMDLLAEDPMKTSHLLDWTAKAALIKAYVDRGVDIADPKLKLIDLQYSDIDPAKSLYHALVRKGRMLTLATDEEIEQAANTPPADSRAWFRGAVSARFGEDIIAASWQTMILKYSEGTARLQTGEVDKLTREHVGEIINSAENTDELLAGLAEIGFTPDHYITHHNKTHINKPHQH